MPDVVVIETCNTDIMATNEGLTNKSADDETLLLWIQIRRIFWRFQFICARILFLLIIFSLFMTRSACGMTLMIQRRLDIRQGNT